VGASLVFGYLSGDDMGLKEIEVEAFGRRSRATLVERCAYDPGGERVRL
jgi:4-methylaminobutanoate oxidase (formaldehyde-forming)